MNRLVGQKIKELRECNRWTQLELGSKFNPPKDSSLISRWERGRVIPSAENIAELSSIFDIKTDDLLCLGHRQTSQSTIMQEDVS